MSDLSEKLDAIQARAKDCITYNFGLRSADKLAHEDVPFLLALVREQDAKLARVEALAVKWQAHFPYKSSEVRHALGDKA